ncbi:MAG: hypothetical protein RL685_3581 [Pseudomonadota bacterium]|jgi:hypothetical protein
MSNDNAEIIGEEMFIEELGQVQGGLSISLYTRGLNEDGPVTFPRPDPKPQKTKPIWIVGTPLPPVTTMMWGGGENAAVPPVAVPLSDR